MSETMYLHLIADSKVKNEGISMIEVEVNLPSNLESKISRKATSLIHKRLIFITVKLTMSN